MTKKFGMSSAHPPTSILELPIRLCTPCYNSKVIFSFQSPADIEVSRDQLQKLVSGPDSDMANFLAGSSETGFLLSTVARIGERIVGWALCDKFTTRGSPQAIVTVFVDEAYRHRGIGTRLVYELLQEYHDQHIGLKLRAGPERFWSRWEKYKVRQISLLLPR